MVDSNLLLSHARSYGVTVCVRVYRHLLHPVICHHHAKHQPPQPECEGQAYCGTIHLHEQRNQRWRRLTWRPAQGQSGFKTFLLFPSSWLISVSLCLPLILNLLYSRLTFFIVESVWEHQEWAFQNPRGWRQRPHTHFLQPRQGGLAAKTGWVTLEIHAHSYLGTWWINQNNNALINTAGPIK